jgi:hypothetical protein
MCVIIQTAKLILYAFRSDPDLGFRNYAFQLIDKKKHEYIAHMVDWESGYLVNGVTLQIHDNPKAEFPSETWYIPAEEPLITPDPGQGGS